jgi:hypothetical protein
MKVEFTFGKDKSEAFIATLYQMPLHWDIDRVAEYIRSQHLLASDSYRLEFVIDDKHRHTKH